MEVPINKDPDWQRLKWIESEVSKARHMFDIEKECEEYHCDELKTFDFQSEIEWYKQKIFEMKSPVVFTHNDYRSANLLITEPNDQLVICDFEEASYGYRGFDLVP